MSSPEGGGKGGVVALKTSGEVVNLKRHIRQVHKDVPDFEIPSLLEKLKTKPKRTYPVYNCCEQGCSWKGTRPDKHLQSKAHR